MNLLIIWILHFCIVSIFANFDAKEFFCGKKLDNTLIDLCSIFNSPLHGIRRTSYRLKRQIVEECCHSPCTRRHLAVFYCAKPHSYVIKLLESPVTEETTTTESPRIKEIKPTKSNSLPVGTNKESSNLSSSSSSHDNKIVRGKRNCKCRKRRTKRLNRFRQRNLVSNPAPPPNIGRIENSQQPFYVWKVFNANF